MRITRITDNYQYNATVVREGNGFIIVRLEGQSGDTRLSKGKDGVFRNKLLYLAWY